MAHPSASTSKNHHRKQVQTSAPAENDTEPGRMRATGGAGRGIWSGSISFGLLQIPVTLYAAESRTEELHFRLLDKHDHSPIRYERVNASTGKPVEWKDIVKGYEIEKDEFVIVEPEDFAKANVEKTQTIDIQDFVRRDEIDPAYFDTPYYLIPQGRAVKAYVLLRDALEKKQSVAIATFVLRTREHLVALMPVDNAIMLETLRFGHELKPVEKMPLPTLSETKDVGARELEMAERLIDGMMTDFEPTKYKDRYYGDVVKLIEEKAKTGVAKAHFTEKKGVVAHDVVDLLDLLKKSLAATKSEAPKATRAERKAPVMKNGHRRAVRRAS